MWWDNQSDIRKEEVKQLVKSGQLELINGGVSSSDEACPYYQDLIENIMRGHKFINEHFGVQPRIGWNIDPFGHSNTNAALFDLFGFDAVFYARVDYQEKEERKKNKTLEYVHRPVWHSKNEKHNDVDVPANRQIFTHILYDHYRSPDGFCFDTLCRPKKTWVNDGLSSRFNADRMAARMIKEIEKRASVYRTKDILMLFGDDFRYMDAQ
jgi:lysosomal alpha-mannosidase